RVGDCFADDLAIAATLQEVHTEAERNSRQQCMNLLVEARWPYAVEDLKHILSQPLASKLPRLPVLPEKMRQFMRDGEALLRFRVSSIQEHHTVIGTNQQAGTKCPVVRPRMPRNALLRQPIVNAGNTEFWQEDQRQAEGDSNRA